MMCRTFKVKETDMSKAIDDLKHEHEAILFTLKVLDKVAGAAEGSGAFNPVDAQSLVDFLKEFADKCHHGKEEGILFPALQSAGIPNEGGPIGIMLSEHVQGRTFIKGMERALANSPDKKAFSHNAQAYIALLRSHIEKENTVLFVMGENALDSATLASIYDRFEAHERDVIGPGRHEELHAMLDRFEAKYLK